MQAESWLYTESCCGADIRAVFWGEKTNTAQGFPKGELSPSENPSDKLPTDLPENFTGISYFFELTFLENLVLQTSWNPCILNQISF